MDHTITVAPPHQKTFQTVIILQDCVLEGNGVRLEPLARYHDIVPAIDRVEIGYTWYGASWQKSRVARCEKTS